MSICGAVQLFLALSLLVAVRFGSVGPEKWSVAHATWSVGMSSINLPGSRRMTGMVSG